MSLFKMSTTQKNGYLFQHDGYSHQRVSNKINKDGSVGWRCKNLRNNFGCKATCTTMEGKITRFTKVEHKCQREEGVDIVFHNAKRDILDYIKKAPTNSHPNNVFDNES